MVTNETLDIILKVVDVTIKKLDLPLFVLSLRSGAMVTADGIKYGPKLYVCIYIKNHWLL